MLKVEGLTTHYGSSQVLFGIDLEFGTGQVATLLGRNGMGKTTTIHSICGIVRPSGGSIVFDGEELVGKPSFRIANLGIGLVPEGRQIFPNLTLWENLVATASNHLGLPDPWTVEKVFDLFPELAERRSSMGNLLSGGEQQMLAIGRALMTNPKLLILDEATEGLAPLVRRRIWEALSRIRGENLSILVVDKNLSDLLRIADVNFIVERGRVVWRGTSDELRADREALHRYLGV
ncbi:branched-chain amino acid transport system ATP-binding protein [Meinhardsimonia xiamenensis]|jgi:branched-chain amino acid transport system ATP-binding protein|uniref:Branched-chain amino acid transport system ATP-binding protein n=1 Tax=Meinhardsimonia xiamenensis TaxID=990712 RepID=A0A1G9A9R4_9RHOB|nr:ABC transporter ATP-binding protein [Meinhardsimonia xiamenensis]PRX35478.1 amino acid/amide ABC transporter ATP-binding protein 2 (HAAT family) [Meinhardsimonia xiamenensis]SDK24106.1 branched-chain amino acid transport system ATP-binding protein [Meinhardsimonia xiamenensis]